jgi:hypothetical protein
MVNGMLTELDDHNCWTMAEAAGHPGRSRPTTPPKDTTTGTPHCSCAGTATPALERRYVFAGEPFQRFLYKELVKAWKRAGR